MNGQVSFDYKIAELHTSSPTASLYEFPLREQAVTSAFSAFDECVSETLAGNIGALRYGRCPEKLVTLSRGAGKKFSYAELRLRRSGVVRIDPFLGERAQAIIAPPPQPGVERKEWFKGEVNASFDGTIEAVDLRGALPEVTLILTAGQKEIDCVCRADDIENIREGLHHRVRISGRAIYDGKSGLPRRIHVASIERVEGGSFAAWNATISASSVIGVPPGQEIRRSLNGINAQRSVR